MIELNFVSIILLIVGYLVGLLTKNYLPTYVSEKAKNLATKEDIEGITNKIEGVKSQYIAQIEQLKSDLALALANESKLQEKRRESLINFFEDCLILLNDKLPTNPGSFTVEEANALFEHQRSVEKLFTQINADYYRVLVYFEAKGKVVEAAGELAKAAWLAGRFYRSNFGPVKTSIIQEMYAIKSQKYIGEVAEASDEALRNFNREFEPLLGDMSAAFNEYMSVLNDSFISKDGRASLLPFEIDK